MHLVQQVLRVWYSNGSSDAIDKSIRSGTIGQLEPNPVHFEPRVREHHIMQPSMQSVFRRSSWVGAKRSSEIPAKNSHVFISIKRHENYSSLKRKFVPYLVYKAAELVNHTASTRFENQPPS